MMFGNELGFQIPKNHSDPRRCVRRDLQSLDLFSDTFPNDPLKQMLMCQEVLKVHNIAMEFLNMPWRSACITRVGPATLTVASNSWEDFDIPMATIEILLKCCSDE